MKKAMLFIILLLLPIVQSASISLSLDSVIIEGQTEIASVLIQTDTLFQGYVSLTYENLLSSTPTIIFYNYSFKGTGPFSYPYNWSLHGIKPGPYLLSAKLAHSDGTIIQSIQLTGIVNSSAPIILSKSPAGIVTATSTTIEVTTNEYSACRYSTSNTTYDDMSNTFTLTNGKTHSRIITGLAEQTYTYYVRCKDTDGYEMKKSAVIGFDVDLPPSAEIDISDSSPVKAGTIEATVVTSENLEIAPKLEYSFNDAPNSRQIISLTRSGSLWKGYMIITETDDNKVGTFYFSGKDSRGTIGNLITEGKIFLVDTTKPPAPLNIETILIANGNIKLRWYYEGEPVDSFNVYRSTSSGVNYIDFYGSVTNGTQFIDTSVTDKVTYYYKVSAIDKASNIGPLSAEVYATSIKEGAEDTVEEDKTITVEPKVLPPNLVLKVNDMIKKVEQLEIDVKDIGSKFQDSGGEKKELIDEFGLINLVDEAKNTINQLKKQLINLKLGYRTSSELDSELKSLDLELKKIRKTLPKDIALLEKAEFIQNTADKDAKTAVDEIFLSFNEKEKSDYIYKNRQIQKDINIEVTIRLINIVYLDESSKEETFIRKKISYLNPDSIEDVIIAEIIPEAIVGEINFKTDGYEMVRNDIIKWAFLKLDFKGKNIEYSIEKKINADTAKEAKTVVLLSPVQLEKSPEIVGYSIFSLFKKDFEFSGKERFGIWLGIIIIILLGGYYAIFIRGNLEDIKKQIKQSLMKKNEKTDSRSADLNSYPHIFKLKEEPADIDQNKQYVSIKNLMILCQEFISTDDFDKAALLYPKVQLLYRKLPREFQGDIYRECLELQKSISEGKDESYGSIL